MKKVIRYCERTENRCLDSILQDELFHYMTEQGFKGFQRGEYGSMAEHLTSLQYLMYGFKDYSSFFRAFKKEYGISPKEFREMNSVDVNEFTNKI